MKKYLETEKYKHKSEKIKISGPNKSFTSVRYSFDIAKTKDDYKNDNLKRFEIISGNSANANAFYKKNTFDIIAGDLPYGVQHGSVTRQKQTALTRNPAELLENCLPVWASVLKQSGAIALSWNINVLPRADISRLLAKCGFTVRDEPAYMGFEHRVDQSIVRDIVVAIKN
jgi:tRNA G10  N-methylase Trm11